MVETYHRRPRRKNITMTELPYDVFYNILLRLPVRSLICCLCVSKQWHSIIKSPMFANTHLKHITHDDHQKHHKLLVIDRKGPCAFSFSTFDCETLDVGPCRPVPFEVANIWIQSSCNGLVLVTLKKAWYDEMLSDLILWNPLTGDYKTLTKPKYYKELYSFMGNHFEMYYHSSEQDYRLLRITYRRNVYIYSLKSDTWRRIIKLKDAFQSQLDLIPIRWSAGASWNENLYFHKYGNKCVMFDTKTENFTEIETSFIQNGTCSRFTVERGCMYLCVKYHITRYSNEYIGLWKMNEDGGWEKVSTYTQDGYLHLFLQPLHLMRDGNWLMKSQSNSDGIQVYKVDLENKHNKGSPCLNKPNGLKVGKYIETFVSPNCYMN